MRKSAEKCKKCRKERAFLSGSNMSSDEDVPAPSPSAAVLARRASRKVKPMREESGSDEDAQEPEDWEDDDEASSEEDESDEEVRVSNAQRGRVRLHYVSQSANGLEVDDDDDRRKSLGEKGWARRAVVVRGVEPSGAAVFEAVPGREEYDLGEDGSAAWAQDMLEFADDNFNDAGIEVRSMGGARSKPYSALLPPGIGRVM